MDKCNSAKGRQERKKKLKKSIFTALLGEKLSEGKEMLKVTPKPGLGKEQAKPKCLTNRQQIRVAHCLL